MANLIDNGIQAQNINVVLRAYGLMAALALFGMVFGSIGGYFASDAAVDRGVSLRSGIYRSIQRFSFGNLDKYSTAGLVTPSHDGCLKRSDLLPDTADLHARLPR